MIKKSIHLFDIDGRILQLLFNPPAVTTLNPLIIGLPHLDQAFDDDMVNIGAVAAGAPS